MRRAVYRAWRALPLPVQRLILHVALPRVSLGTCAVIFDAAGRLLVVRHSYRRQPWGLPGGFVRRGEQPAAALERELQEELGVEVTVSRLLFTEKDELDRHLTVYYQARVLGAVCPNDAELDGYRYVSLRELPALFPVVPPSWVRGMEEAMAA
jgi:ADP-ribose pyrophosphatase YjhB (NUDIX family)